MGEEIKNFFKELISIVVIAFVLAMILRTFVVEGRIIPSGSMLPTIQLQDRVMVNKFIYYFKDPVRGDIVVFDPRVFDSCIKEKALGSPKRAYFFVKFTILLLSIFW
jgi:signal peptidase I